MISAFGKPMRPHLEALVQGARDSLLISSPYIGLDAARWICGLVARRGSGLRMRTLTSISVPSVAAGALDMGALKELAANPGGGEVINLPRLHAKVYVADCSVAIVTSANLTEGGLEGNYEYGLAIDAPAIVRRIRGDLDAYASVGNQLSWDELVELAAIGEDLRAAWQRASRSAEGPSTRKFRRLVRSMRQPVLAAQVGTRSAHSIYCAAICFALRDGPLTTDDLHPRIQQLLPDLCDDSKELVIHGQRFGKRWKHDVRNAQQGLKKAGVVALRQSKWTLETR